MPRGEERIAEIDRCKQEIGWTWNTLRDWFHFSPSELARIRSGHMEIPEPLLDYLRMVASAVKAIPVPDLKQHQEATDMVENGLRAAGAMPANEAPAQRVDVPVMMMETIAERLVVGYQAFRVDPELSEEERRGAMWAIGQLAERFGVRDKVREMVKASAPRPTPAVVDEPWSIPQSPRPPLVERVPFGQE